MVGDKDRWKAIVSHTTSNEVADDVRSIGSVEGQLRKLGEDGIKSQHKVPVVDHMTKKVGEKH